MNARKATRHKIRQRSSYSRWLRLVTIPLLGLLMPLFLSHSQNYMSRDFMYLLLFSVTVTVVIWEGNAFIVRGIRGRLKWETSPVSRAVAQIGLTLSFSISAFVLLSWLFSPLLYKNDLHNARLSLSILGVSIVTMLLNAIYESIYFSRQWRFSVMRAEVLKRAALRSEYESLKNQVNPYFLFNSLNTLEHLIEIDNAEAGPFVQGLAGAYRYLLQNKDYRLVRLEEELRFTETYAFLLNTRYGDALSVVYTIEEDELKKSLPPMCMQILVENAVKYNSMSREHPLRIHIAAREGYLTVSNNLQPKPVEEEYTKLGLNNIRNRYKELSRRPVEIRQGEGAFIVRLPLI